MKKLFLSTVIICFVLVGISQPMPASRVASISNYQEVLTEIKYPKIGKEKGIEGQVILSLTINEQGKLLKHSFVSSPSREFEEAVKHALPKLRFIPAINEEGITTSSTLTLPIKFELTI
ncbi:MAG: energy transducer TonB [Bacteroidota bacterium]